MAHGSNWPRWPDHHLLARERHAHPFRRAVTGASTAAGALPANRNLDVLMPDDTPRFACVHAGRCRKPGSVICRLHLHGGRPSGADCAACGHRVEPGSPAARPHTSPRLRRHAPPPAASRARPATRPSAVSHRRGFARPPGNPTVAGLASPLAASRARRATRPSPVSRRRAKPQAAGRGDRHGHRAAQTCEGRSRSCHYWAIRPA